MKITAISDLHGYLPNLPPCDLLVIAGDICPDNSFTLDRKRLGKCAEIQARWLEDAYVPWLRTQEWKECVYVWGNHDFVGEFPSLLPPFLGHLLNGTGTAVDLGGELIRIWGAPWVGNIPQWAFNLPQAELTRKWKDIPSALDILVTHAPPYGVGDFCRGYGPVGDPGLTRRLGDLHAQNLGPGLHFFGHIHEGRGVYADGTHNVSYVDHTYKPYDLDIVTLEYKREVSITL